MGNMCFASILEFRSVAVIFAIMKRENCLRDKGNGNFSYSLKCWLQRYSVYSVCKQTKVIGIKYSRMRQIDPEGEQIEKRKSC